MNELSCVATESRRTHRPGKAATCRFWEREALRKGAEPNMIARGNLILVEIRQWQAGKVIDLGSAMKPGSSFSVAETEWRWGGGEGML